MSDGYTIAGNKKDPPSIHLSFDGADHVECVGEMEVGKTVTIAITGKLVRKSTTESEGVEKEPYYDPNHASVKLEKYSVKLITTTEFDALADD